MRGGRSTSAVNCRGTSGDARPAYGPFLWALCCSLGLGLAVAAAGCARARSARQRATCPSATATASSARSDLLRMLTSESAQDRTSGAWLVLEHGPGDDEVFGLLRRLLQDEVLSVRAAAANVLCRMDVICSTETLDEALRRGTRDEAEVAAITIQRLGSRGSLLIPSLAAALDRFRYSPYFARTLVSMGPAAEDAILARLEVGADRILGPPRALDLLDAIESVGGDCSERMAAALTKLLRVSAQWGAAFDAGSLVIRDPIPRLAFSMVASASRNEYVRETGRDMLREWRGTARQALDVARSGAVPLSEEELAIVEPLIRELFP